MTFRLNCGSTCRNPASCSVSGQCLATGAALTPSNVLPLRTEADDALEAVLRQVAVEAVDAAPDSKAMDRFRAAFPPGVVLALLDQAAAGDELAKVLQHKLPDRRAELERAISDAGDRHDADEVDRLEEELEALGPRAITVCPSCKGDKRQDPAFPLELSKCRTCDGLGTVPADSVAALGDDEPFEVVGGPEPRRFAIDPETSLYMVGAFLRDKDLRLEVRSNGETWLAIAAEQLDDGERSRGLSPVHAGPTGAIVAALSAHLKTPSWVALEDDVRIDEDDQLRPNPPAPMMRLLAFSRLAREEGRTVRQFRIAFGEASGVYRKRPVEAAAVPVRADNDELLRALGKAAREGIRSELLAFAGELEKQRRADEEGLKSDPRTAAEYFGGATAALLEAAARRDPGLGDLAVEAALYCYGIWWSSHGEKGRR